MRILVLVGCLFGVVSLRADDSDLIHLKQQRQTAVENALAPINKIYKEKLEELLRQTTAKQDLDTAVKIKAELDDLNKPQTADVDPTSQKHLLEHKLINTKWVFPQPSVPKNKQYIEFKPNGLLVVGWGATQGFFHWSVSDQERSVIVRPYNSQDAFEVIVFEDGLKKGIIKFPRGEAETTPYR